MNSYGVTCGLRRVAQFTGGPRNRLALLAVSCAWFLLGTPPIRAAEPLGIGLIGGTARDASSGKPIAANCHGPLLVLATGLAKGRTLTCYPDLEPDVRAGGGEFVNRDVVVDGTLVTVRGWPDNGPWMREFVRLLRRTYPQAIGANRTVAD